MMNMQETPEPVEEITVESTTETAVEEAPKKKGVVRRLYDWVLSWAHTPYGTPALFVLSFMESSFFPIPPDVLQIALSAGRPRRSFWYAAVSLVGSVLGAVLGFVIGMFFWEMTKDLFIPRVFSQENFDLVCRWYREYGFWAVFAAAVTPIPYKIFTIAAGVCSLSLPLLLFASLIGRGARFFAVAALMFLFGEKIESWIDRYFNWLAIAFTVLLIGGFVVIKFLMK